MMTMQERAQSVPMSDEGRGHAIKARRLAFGIKSERAFAEATGVDRRAIARAEAGQASEGTYDRLEAWLDAFQEETGSDERETPHVVTFTLTSGGDVAVSGPVENLAELEAAVERLMRHQQRPPSE